MERDTWLMLPKFPLSGTKARRPALDRMLDDAHHRRFDVLVGWAFDWLARSVRHFLQLLDELDHLGVEFVSFREHVDSSGPLGRAMVTILGAVAGLERNLIIERVRSGMRRARLEGVHIGGPKLIVNREAVLRDRQQGVQGTASARSPSYIESRKPRCAGF
jgi:DNA invertase Pin-like site-specific DNA recombinase